MNQKFGGGWLEDTTGSQWNDWEFNTDPGQTGPDARWMNTDVPSPLPDGADIAELKPFNPTAIQDAQAQVDAWKEGPCALYVYDQAGNIYYWGVLIPK